MTNRLLIAVLSLFFCSCGNMNRDKLVDKKDLIGSDYRLFQSTPAWELAKAVQDESESRINEIVAKDPKLINYQDPKYGNTLLMLTIKNQQIKPFELLLENKADVSIHNIYDGTSALIEACNSKHYDIKFADVLLQNGADINDVEVGKRRVGNTTRFTPLMAAARTGNLELVKLLVEKGADLNYQNEYKQSALGESILGNEYETVFLLLKNGADYSLPIDFNEEQNKIYYLVDELRFHLVDLDTDEYKYKMQIVDFLKSKGIDYRATPIPDYIKKKAQENYPNNWKEYLDKY